MDCDNCDEDISNNSNEHSSSTSNQAKLNESILVCQNKIEKKPTIIRMDLDLDSDFEGPILESCSEKSSSFSGLNDDFNSDSFVINMTNCSSYKSTDVTMSVTKYPNVGNDIRNKDCNLADVKQRLNDKLSLCIEPNKLSQTKPFLWNSSFAKLFTEIKPRFESYFVYPVAPKLNAARAKNEKLRKELKSTPSQRPNLVQPKRPSTSSIMSTMSTVGGTKKPVPNQTESRPNTQSKEFPSTSKLKTNSAIPGKSNAGSHLKRAETFPKIQVTPPARDPTAKPKFLSDIVQPVVDKSKKSLGRDGRKSEHGKKGSNDKNPHRKSILKPAISKSEKTPAEDVEKEESIPTTKKEKIALWYKMKKERTRDCFKNFYDKSFQRLSTSENANFAIFILAVIFVIIICVSIIVFPVVFLAFGKYS